MEISRTTGLYMPNLVRKFTTDAGRRVLDTAAPVIKTIVASFKGTAYSAERTEDGELQVFLTTVEPLQTETRDHGAFGRGMTAAELSRLLAARRAAR